MHVCFSGVCFRFSVLSQEIGWEERLRNDYFVLGAFFSTKPRDWLWRTSPKWLFCVGWGI